MYPDSVALCTSECRGELYKCYLPIGVLGLQAKCLDNIDADQALLGPLGSQLVELSWGYGDGWVFWEGINFEKALKRRRSQLLFLSSSPTQSPL